MSKNTVILLVVLCLGIAGMITFSKMRSNVDAQPGQAQSGNETTSGNKTQPATASSDGKVGFSTTPGTPTTATTATDAGVATSPQVVVNASNTATTHVAVLPPIKMSGPNSKTDTNDVPQLKPIPVLEKDYATATNRDVRLDIMMDIAETTGPEAVRALTRLFEAETDTDLKIDLLDSLLGIDGYKEEKLIMLTMGSRQGLPSEVRQSAIDGLIDLDDPRVVPVLNGLLNDPDVEIREGAKDALEMLQTQPPVKLGK